AHRLDPGPGSVRGRQGGNRAAPRRGTPRQRSPSRPDSVAFARGVILPMPVSSNFQPVSLHDLDFASLSRLLEADGVNPHHANALFRALQREGASAWGRDDYLPPLRRWLDQKVGPGKAWALDQPELVDDIASSDGLTRKFLLRLRDGPTIEPVLMGY